MATANKVPRDPDNMNNQRAEWAGNALTLFANQTACAHCGQDIEFTGKSTGWRDRGGNVRCVPYVDKAKGETVKPKTFHPDRS